MMPLHSNTYARVAHLVDDQEDTACLLLREDFASCGSDEAVGTALNRLVTDGRLAQLRDDAYAFVEWSDLFNKVILRCSLQDLAREYAVRRGAEIRLSSAQAEYNAGSTQVPNGCYVGVSQPIEGRLQFRQRTVEYECV